MLIIARHADKTAGIYSVPEDATWSDEALACFPLDAENMERLKSVANWSPGTVEMLFLRDLMRKANEKDGVGRQETVDHFMQLQMMREAKNKGNNGNK